MAGSVIRDPAGDHLLTPQNAALFVIDYQPSQIAAVTSMDRDLLLENIVSTVKTAKAFGLPIVHSTINVATGRGKPTVPELAELLADYPPDRPDDHERVGGRRVRRRGARHRAAKLILCALWTEICMTFPALDALREGYDVYPVVDAIGGTSPRRPIAPASSGSSRPAAIRSAGSRSPSSSSATGPARRRWPM